MSVKGQTRNIFIIIGIISIPLMFLTGGFFRGIVTAFFVAIYMFPAYLAQSKGHPQNTSITMLNMFLGWTFLGWVGALVWACSDFDQSKRKDRWIDVFNGDIKDPNIKKDVDSIKESWKQFRIDMKKALDEFKKI